MAPDHARDPAASAAPDPARDRAFADLFRAQYPRVQAYLARRMADPEAARDLAAEVFGLAWEQVSAQTTPSLPAPGWLFVTARNLLANSRRKTGRAVKLRATMVGEITRDPLPGTTPGPDGEDAGGAEPVRAALADVPARHREILMAHYWDGLTGAECAALLGCTTPAVWMRLSRARAAFRLAYETLEVKQ